MPHVSFYPDSVTTTGQPLALPELLAGIKSGRWRSEVEAARAVMHNKGAYAKAKQMLPSFTASGTFTTRKDAELVVHSGLLCLDIDAKDANAGVDLVAARARIEADSYAYAVAASTGGVGFFVLVRIPAADHKGSFRALAAYFLTEYGVAVDQACKNVSRLRFVSYDPALHLNEGASTFEETLTAPARPASAPPIAASTWRASAHGDGYGQRALERACDKVREAADGEKRTVLNKQALLCGGYIAAGFLTDAEAVEALRAAISSREVDDIAHAYKTIAIAIADGKQRPVLPWDLQYQVRQQLRAEVRPEVVVSMLSATQGIAASVLEAAVQDIVEEQRKERPVLLFWEMVKSGNKRDAPLKPVLRLKMLREFLARHGFRKYEPDPRAKVKIVHRREQIVYEVSRSQLKDFVLAQLSELPFEFDGTYRDHIEELLQSQHRLLFDEGTQEFLPALSGNFVRDTAEEAYLFYRNGVVVATKDGPELRPYAELPGLVWAEQLRGRDFTRLSREEIAQGEFFRFLWNLAGKKTDRLDALLLFLGYYLHGYKDPSNPRIGVLLDESLGNMDGQANGGSGKSLLFKAIGQMVKVLEVDGKGYDPRNAKALQQVSDATRVVFFNDWETQRVPFDRLYNFATDTLTIERLYSGQQSYDFAVSPKFGITTNGIITGKDSSHDRRKYEVEIAAHYHAGHQPRDEFGHNFFGKAWSTQEWARFDNLMVDACCRYLCTGGRLVAPVSVGLDQRRLLAATSAGFVAFMDAQPRGQKLYRNSLVSEFRVAEGYDEKAFTPERFGRWLLQYKLLSNDFQQGQDGGGQYIGHRWIILAQTATRETHNLAA